MKRQKGPTRTERRREVFYELTAVHALGERRAMGVYRRYVQARADGLAIEKAPGWHGQIDRRSIPTRRSG